MEIKLLIIFFIIIQIELFCTILKPKVKLFNKKKREEAVKVLMNKKMEDDLVLEKDKDINDIDIYIAFIKTVLDNYNNSRSKKISYRTRQTLLIETFKILPTISKYITLDYYYNLDDKEWYNLTDRDMMMLLESSYNDYTHDNLDSLNSIITAVLRLRDDRR